MTKRPTILDVARTARVSKSTVSLVLQSSSLVKAETAETVRAAMAEVGYVYNRAAANLRSTSVGLIGLVINDLRNPFFTEFATSVQMALSAKGYATVVANSDEDPDLQAQLIGSMIEHGVSALIISPAYGEPERSFGPIIRAGVPAMQVLRQVEARRDHIPFSSFDYIRGGELATRHLLEQGAKNIAFVGGLEGRAITNERMAGYLKVMAETGSEPLVFHGRSSRSFGNAAADLITNKHPEIDAAVCFNDLVALGMLSGFARLGRKLGKEFCLVGFDDIEECAQVWPQLSSVSCDIAAFGQHTASAMLEWLEKDKHPETEYRAGVELIVRSSSLRVPAR
ncbi:LacI family DNA-binding transcriptional regulator [Roseibium marinum]|uniref:LacI family transcriptional regulator n=1 Tax=Roseibium marinum TaxID=281252 RepID=A0A2S3UT39_9HYPH|nr:LacI family DNA-binding transcriptional regulator [Roseibium marinum]POF30885.1 LacI family transcriptional regulator [Roseibium marinum]